MVYGGIELGGTNVVCAFAEQPDDPLHGGRIAGVDPQREIETALANGDNRVEFATGDKPARTLDRIASFFQKVPLQCLGIASFGPVDLKKGAITSTPKPGWRHAALVEPLRERLDCPVAFETDVNGAVLGERYYGAGQDVTNLVYFTIGTGIGGGALVDDHLVHGLVHTEMGHIPVKLHPHDLASGFRGSCLSFHAEYDNCCLEGMANGPAIKARFGWTDADLPNVPADHIAWDIEAYYLAQAVCSVLYVLSPQRVILGGGVMEKQGAHLLPRIQAHVIEWVNGYIDSPIISKDKIDTFVVMPGLGDNAGIVGALKLAQLQAQL